jgi:hypothetical protein
LAHRHLGHAEQAQQWRGKAGEAGAWEEAVMQRQLVGELNASAAPIHP